MSVRPSGHPCYTPVEIGPEILPVNSDVWRANIRTSFSLFNGAVINVLVSPQTIVWKNGTRERAQGAQSQC